MKRKYIILIVLLLYTAIIFLPPLMYGYVYPNNGDDTAVHLAYFDLLKDGENIGLVYFGRILVGYPMIWINQLTDISIDTQFLWFNFIALWLVGITIFVLISKISGWKSGLLAIPIVMFASPGVLGLYDTGSIFDLMTVSVVLPLTLICLAYGIAGCKLRWFIPAVFFGVLGVVLHSIVIFIMHPVDKQIATPVSEFFGVLWGYPVLLFVIALGYCLYKFKDLTKIEKTLVIIFGTVVVLFIPLTFTAITAWATRFAVNLAILMTLFTAVMAGILHKYSKPLARIGLVALVVAMSLPVLSTYFQYNSAVKPIDLEAIRYVNTIPSNYFSCSLEVSPAIYERFLHKKYQLGALPCIVRNKPMTSWTTPGSRDYRGGDTTLLAVEFADGGLEKSAKFADGGLEINVVD